MLNFMGNFGQAVGRFLPKGFTDTFANFGKAMVNGAKGIYNGTVGRVFETVTGAMKNGLDILSQTVTGKTQGGWGTDLSEWFKNFNEHGFGKGPTAAETIQGDLNIPTSLPEAAPPGILMRAINYLQKQHLPVFLMRDIKYQKQTIHYQKEKRYYQNKKSRVGLKQV